MDTVNLFSRSSDPNLDNKTETFKIQLTGNAGFPSHVQQVCFVVSPLLIKFYGFNLSTGPLLRQGPFPGAVAEGWGRG